MSTNEPVTALAPRVELGTLAATTPTQLLAGAQAIAKPLADLIEQQKLYSVISGRRYVRVEGWTTLGAMLGVVAREVENVEHEGVYVARVQLVRLNDGAVISEASAECGGGEPLWQQRPPYARRSMAATRATGKACRLAFSWVMTLAGFEATPAEEMDGVIEVTPPAASAPRDVRSQTPSDRKGKLVISEAQRGRLFRIAHEAGWKDDEIKAVVKLEAGLDHTSDIVRGKYKGEYDALCAIFQAAPDQYAWPDIDDAVATVADDDDDGPFDR